MIRVVVADDQAVVRAGFRTILESEEDIEVVAEASDGAAAATRQLAGEVPALVVTTFDLDEYVFAALRAGATGFLLTDWWPRPPPTACPS